MASSFWWAWTTVVFLFIILRFFFLIQPVPAIVVSAFLTWLAFSVFTSEPEANHAQSYAVQPDVEDPGAIDREMAQLQTHE